MDDEELIDEEVEDEAEEQEEPHLTILQSFGLIILLIILQLLSSLLLTKSGTPLSDETSWPSIAVTHALAGFLTAKAGAILAGFSLAALFVPINLRVRDFIFVVVAVAGLTILSSELSNFLQRIQPISDSYTELFDRLMQQNVAGVILGIGMIAPLTEELIFRGVIFEGLKKRYPVSTAFFASTLLFSMVHILPWLIINAFLIGAFLAWVKLRTGSLTLCVIAHALFNSVPFLLIGNLAFKIRGFTTGATSKIEFQPLWFDLMGVALVAAGIAGIYYATRDVPSPALPQPE